MDNYSGPTTDIIVDLKRAAIKPFLREHPAASDDEIVSEVIRLMQEFPERLPTGAGVSIRDESGLEYPLGRWVAIIRHELAEWPGMELYEVAGATGSAGVTSWKRGHES
jgi:hypothetical protein